MSNAAVRAEFLNRQWRRYPRFSTLDFPAHQWAWGRIESLQEDSFTLQNMHSLWHFTGNKENHPVLGASVPEAALKKGDYVVFLKEAPARIYLLSPCLEEAPGPMDSQWPLFLDAVAAYFKEQGFTHWRTPYLVTSSGVDAHIDFFKVEGVRTQSAYALPTSPELELKKAIAAGQERIFEIKSSFRDDDLSPHHRPEFKMLEWYRSYEDKWVLLEDIRGLVNHLQSHLQLKGMGALPPIRRRSISELFKQYVGIELSPRTAKMELSLALSKAGLDQSASDDWDDLFFRLYIEKIEPHLGSEGLEAIYNFPATQGSLSRMTEEGWSDRFEIYWQGVELANAYQEQNDPYLIEVRVRAEVQKRRSLGRVAHGIDEEFLRVMRGGFPPCAGIALGLDRLYMVLQGRSNI